MPIESVPPDGRVRERLASLESDVEHLTETLGELRTDSRAVRDVELPALRRLLEDQRVEAAAAWGRVRGVAIAFGAIWTVLSLLLVVAVRLWR